MNDFYSEQAFLEAWKRGVAIAGEQWFGDGTRHSGFARSKWDLSPRMDKINDDIGVLSSGEAVFLAAMVSFYNSYSGGELLQRAVGVKHIGLADIAASLDEPRRRVIAGLLVSYNGW